MIKETGTDCTVQLVYFTQLFCLQKSKNFDIFLLKNFFNGMLSLTWSFFDKNRKFCSKMPFFNAGIFLHFAFFDRNFKNLKKKCASFFHSCLFCKNFEIENAFLLFFLHEFSNWTCIFLHFCLFLQKFWNRTCKKGRGCILYVNKKYLKKKSWL